MGIQQRTAISTLRLQRQVAEERRLNLSAQKPAAGPARVSFRAVDRDRETFIPSLSTSGKRPDQEQSSRLVERLRQALAPISERDRQEQNIASRAYASLQDELIRLTAHLQQRQDRQAIDLSLRDLTLPLKNETELGFEEIPCSRIRIVVEPQNATDKHDDETPKRLEKLPVSMEDLRHYRQVWQDHAPKVAAPLLTLVSPNLPEPSVPMAPDLLIADEVQLGQATAKLTERSLGKSENRSKTPCIDPELALSLLGW